jgi:hypothetical protein
MFRSRVRHFRLHRIALGVALLAFPSGALAQHGGGGHIGGAAAGGSGLSGGNHASGVDQKDDLKSFHDVLAAQASSEQAAAYRVMLKSTVAASVELKALEEQAGKENDKPALASRDKTLADALEIARTLNKKFQEGFSSQQKSLLKEIIKRLGKTDSELGQQSKAVDQAVEANAASSVMAGSAQNLDHALADFQRAQVDLGQEMSIDTGNGVQDFTFNLTPVKNSVNFASATMAITTSGTVMKGATAGGENAFAVQLTEDVSDLQVAIADVLRAQLNKNDNCGEWVSILTADLSPQAQAAQVVEQVHFERWTCTTMFGRQSSNEIVEGNGTITLKLMPAVAADGMLHITAQITHVDAGGLVGELLRTGSLGEQMRDKTADTILAIIRQGGEFKTSLPTGARSYATLRSAQFSEAGSGRLMLMMSGDIRVPDDKLAALTGELGQASQVQSVPGPLLTRPAVPQEAVSR